MIPSYALPMYHGLNMRALFVGAPPEFPELPRAIQQQLGLKNDAAKAQVESSPSRAYPKPQRKIKSCRRVKS
jgi:hypothetical protein